MAYHHVTYCPPAPLWTTLTEPVDGHTTPRTRRHRLKSVIGLPLAPSAAPSQEQYCRPTTVTQVVRIGLYKQFKLCCPFKAGEKTRRELEFCEKFVPCSLPQHTLFSWGFWLLFFPRIISDWSQRTRGQNKICIVVGCVKSWGKDLSETVPAHVSKSVQISLAVFVYWNDTTDKDWILFSPETCTDLLKRSRNVGLITVFWAPCADHSFLV